MHSPIMFVAFLGFLFVFVDLAVSQNVSHETSVVAARLAESASCGCWFSAGAESDWYTNYQLNDFRSGFSQWLISEPPVPSNPGSMEPVNSPYFESASFLQPWAISRYSQPASASFPVENAYSAANIWFGQDTPQQGTYLRLRSARTAGFQSSAEIASNFEALHGSFRMHARVNVPDGMAGAVATMFLYLSTGGANDNESDMEILTGGPPNVFQATNQPHVTDNATLPGGALWTDWVEYRMDWTPSSVSWIVNGQLVNTISTAVPQQAAHFIFSLWSNGGTWSGSMNPGQEITMDVAYIEMAYNTTTGGSCSGANLCGMQSQ